MSGYSNSYSSLTQKAAWAVQACKGCLLWSLNENWNILCRRSRQCRVAACAGGNVSLIHKLMVMVYAIHMFCRWKKHTIYSQYVGYWANITNTTDMTLCCKSKTYVVSQKGPSINIERISNPVSYHCFYICIHSVEQSFEYSHFWGQAYLRMLFFKQRVMMFV